MTAKPTEDGPKKKRKWVTVLLFIVGLVMLYQGVNWFGYLLGGLLVVFMGRDLILWKND